ncbi:MAG: alcohol dehydrogenase, partial [Armatimonadetes bacterium]|nr:alcohol dehydrogenase [Armatimonadota bacterium]
MRAIRIHEHGGPEAMRLDEVPDPVPGPGEVLVEVGAAGINHLDVFVRRGMPGVTIPLPRILGADAAGVVAVLGDG